MLSSCSMLSPVQTGVEGLVVKMGVFERQGLPLPSSPLVQPATSTAFPPSVAQGLAPVEIPGDVTPEEDLPFPSKRKSSGKKNTPVFNSKFEEFGLASWYQAAPGRGVTASRERYIPSASSAAHKTLPFGTLVEVLNLDNGRSCQVRINDRGPHRSGRIIDLTPRAAAEIDMIKKGLANVRVRTVPPDEKEGDPHPPSKGTTSEK